MGIQRYTKVDMGVQWYTRVFKGGNILVVTGVQGYSRALKGIESPEGYSRMYKGLQRYRSIERYRKSRRVFKDVQGSSRVYEAFNTIIVCLVFIANVMHALIGQ